MAKEGPEKLGTEYYPSIMWSLGGEIRKAEQVIEVLPPMYSLGWIRSTKIDRFIRIESEKFGFIAFQPSKSDENAVKKIIDIKGNMIYVT